MNALEDMTEAGYTGSLGRSFSSLPTGITAQHTPLIPQLRSQRTSRKLQELLLLEFAQESHLFNCAPISRISRPTLPLGSKSPKLSTVVFVAFMLHPLVTLRILCHCSNLFPALKQ